MAKEKKVKTKGKKSSNNKGLGVKARLFLIVGVLLALVFLPTTMLLFFGMIPSLVAAFVSVRGRGARASTVTAMNLAGCVPYIFKLWSTSNDFEASIDILTSSNALMIIYTAAAFGYLIDWVVTGLVSSFLYQKGIARMKTIKKRQEELAERWGDGVGGN